MIARAGQPANPTIDARVAQSRCKEKIYTFWDYFRQHWQKNSGLRIDHLLLNAELAPRLAGAGVDRWVRGQPGASDHAPTWVQLRKPRSRSAK